MNIVIHFNARKNNTKKAADIRLEINEEGRATSSLCRMELDAHRKQKMSGNYSASTLEFVSFHIDVTRKFSVIRKFRS